MLCNTTISIYFRLQIVQYLSISQKKLPLLSSNLFNITRRTYKNIVNQLQMNKPKHHKSTDKKKRFSQFKPPQEYGSVNPSLKFSPYELTSYNYKFYNNNNSNGGHHHVSTSTSTTHQTNNHNHNRSQSIGAANKNNIRFKTDYQENVNVNGNGNDSGQLIGNNDKKYKLSYYNSNNNNNNKKRNQTENIQSKYSSQNIQRNQRAISTGYGGYGSGVQSTKSNPKKNVQLRLLFNKTKHAQQKYNRPQRQSLSNNKKKGYITTMGNHPLLKYISKNKQYNNVNPIKSPYTSQIQRFQNLYTKMKNSAPKGKRISSNNSKNNGNNRSRDKDKDNNYNNNNNHSNSKQRDRSINSYHNNNRKNQISLSLNKNQIKINHQKQPLTTKQQQKQQQTVKTIKKQNNDDQNLKQYTSKSKNQQISSNLSDGQESEETGYGLTQEQEETFGNRFPYGFEKVKLLGRGGFSLVWLGRHIKSGKQFAIKQIITQNTHQTHIKQIWFGTTFFTLGGIPKPQFSKYPGIKNLVRMYSYQINQSDTWIFYQKCGQSLGSNLYDIRAERVYGDQRLYKIYYKPFYKALADDGRLLKNLIIQICKPLVVLNTCQIVHSDLKTQNILIKYDQQPSPTQQSQPSLTFRLTQTKLIDYGSSFQFKNISQFSMATPQYMPPQILNYIIHQNQGQYQQQLYEQVMNQYKKPWIVDIFSLGCVLLEIVVGVPLWMSLPLLVPNKSGVSYCQKEGLFAVKGRLFPEIIQKQRKVIGKLDQILVNQNYSKINLSPATKEVIKGMLCIDFNKRISPERAIQMLQNQQNI